MASLSALYEWDGEFGEDELHQLANSGDLLAASALRIMGEAQYRAALREPECVDILYDDPDHTLVPKDPNGRFENPVPWSLDRIHLD